MTREQLIQDILSYFRHQTGCASLQAADDLFAGGHLDSLAVMDLLAFLESSVRVRLAVTDLLPANLRTVESIADTLFARRQACEAVIVTGAASDSMNDAAGLSVGEQAP